MKFLLFLAMAFYVFYIWGFLVANFFRRRKAIMEQEVSHKYFKSFSGEAPRHIVVWSRHIDNQFQVPLLYIASVLATIQAGADNLAAVAFAWLFVLLRIVHSYVHLGGNKVLHRASVYASGFLMILLLWVNLLIVQWNA